MNSPVAEFNNRQMRSGDPASQTARLARTRRQDFSNGQAAGRATAIEQIGRSQSAIIEAQMNIKVQMNTVFAHLRLADFVLVAR
jgi:hypothetical protein